MTPKEFQKSNLAIELKAGKKRLERRALGLSDEQCERVGATRSGSVIDLLSELVTNEFLALMEVSDPLSGLPSNLVDADGRIPTASGAEKVDANKSVENLLTELGVLRSAIIRRTEGLEPQRAKYAYVTDVCVTRFNEQIDEIERWRSSEIVGFSAARLRAESRAIVDLSREDFLAGNFDLKSLFSVLLDVFYSKDFVLWLGAAERNGRNAAFQHMADVLEPNTLLETGMASILFFSGNFERAGRRGKFHHRLGSRSRRVLDGESRSLAHRSGMEESPRHRGTHRGSTIAEAVSNR